MRSMSLVVDLIDLVTKHKSGELRCPATALIFIWFFFILGSNKDIHNISDEFEFGPDPTSDCGVICS